MTSQKLADNTAVGACIQALILALVFCSSVQAQDVTATRGVAAGGDINAHDIIIKHGLDEAEVAKLLEGLLEKDRKDGTETAKLLAEYAGKLSVTEAAIKRFFTILGEKDVPRDELLEKFAEIAGRHLRIQGELESQRVSDPDSEALRQKATKAFEAGDYDGAETLLAKLQAKQVESLAHLEAQLDERKREAAGTSFERGQIAMAQLEYLKAAEHFGTASSLLPNDDKETRASYRSNQALALYRQGVERVDVRALPRAVDIYRQVLTVYTRAELPQDWAMTQNDLGNALREQGTRTGGEAGAKLLTEAVTAYRAALEVYTRPELPQQWAMTQNNLGAALSEQGTRTGGEAGAKLLAEAATAYRAALEVYTRTELPQDWAMTQNNLGTALQEQGIRAEKKIASRLLKPWKLTAGRWKFSLLRGYLHMLK